MHEERRKNLLEFWLTPTDILALPDIWIEFSGWSYCQSTHELAKSGFHCKLTSNFRSWAQTATPPVYRTERDTALAILSKNIIEPVYMAGKTSIRFYKPMESKNRLSCKIVLHGYHYCPETVWRDLICYEYYRANMHINVSLSPKHPCLKTADMILDKIPFSVLQEAHNKRLLADLGNYRSERAKKAARQREKTKELDNIIELPRRQTTKLTTIERNEKLRRLVGD